MYAFSGCPGLRGRQKGPQPGKNSKPPTETDVKSESDGGRRRRRKEASGRTGCSRLPEGMERGCGLETSGGGMGTEKRLEREKLAYAVEALAQEKGQNKDRGDVKEKKKKNATEMHLQDVHPWELIGVDRDRTGQRERKRKKNKRWGGAVSY